jgi:hypothetical protein
MSLKIDYVKVTSSNEAYALVKKHLTPEVIARFNVSADVTHKESEKKIQVKGKGFTLSMTFLDRYVDLDLDVSFFLVAMKGVILGKVEKMIRSLV